MTHNQRATVFKRFCGILFILGVVLTLFVWGNYDMHTRQDEAWTLTSSIGAVMIGTGWTALVIAVVIAICWLVIWFFDIKIRW